MNEAGWKAKEPHDENALLQKRLRQAERQLEEMRAELQTLKGNARQHQRMQRELAVLMGIAEITASARHENEIIERATQLVGSTLYPNNFGILLVDEARNLLRPHPSYRGEARETSIQQGIIGHVTRTGHLYHAPDITLDEVYQDFNTEMRSELCVPLLVDNKVIGVLNAESEDRGAFSRSDERLLTILAGQLAMSIKKMRLLREMTQSLQREQRVNQITRTISTAPDLPTVLASVVREATELIEADAGLLGLVIDNQIMTYYPFNLPRHINLLPVPKGRGTSWHILEMGEPVLLDEYAAHSQAQESWIKSGLHAFVGVPIAAGENKLGTLELFSLRPNREFDQRDLDLLEAVGRQAGIAIQNIRLLAEAQQRAGALAASLAKQQELDNMKDRFVQNMSHELRTPLGIIFGYAELLEEGGLGELSEMQQQAVQIIGRRVRMLNNLVDDLSALLAAETQEFRREMIEMAPFMQGLLVEYQIQAGEIGIDLLTEVEEDVPPVIGDPTHLRRVFDNLVANAFKFTSTGGRVTLRMWQERDDILIEVADTGVGISREKLKRIFERFYQMNEHSPQKKKGTGLGLALVKEIVEAHRGKVSVRSTVGEGTTFQIRLPGYGGKTTAVTLAKS